tara:strand:- start:348 stop:1226 length:879 start_codon:yes stop_codon:yes gene_type:complete
MYTIQSLANGASHGGYFMEPCKGYEHVYNNRDPHKIDERLIPGFVDSDAKTQPVLIIGAGMMGKLIAGWLAVRGATVKITDKNEFNKNTSLKSIYADIKSKEVNSEIKENTAELLKSQNKISIYNSEDVNGYLIIETLPENYDIKINVLKQFRNKGATLTTCSLSFDIDLISHEVGQKIEKLRFLYPVYNVGAVNATSGVNIEQFKMNRIADPMRFLNTDEIQILREKQQTRVRTQNEIILRVVSKPDCAICMENSEEVMFNCGHSTVCKSCSYRITQCHVCRSKITSRVNF